mgnify:CR=1 FL=1
MNFYKVWESMHAAPDDGAAEAIRVGLNVRDDFWDDFLMVVNNSGALSELLDVPTTKISGWHEKIKAALSRVREADAQPSDKGKMIKTGLPSENPWSLFTSGDWTSRKTPTGAG